MELRQKVLRDLVAPASRRRFFFTATPRKTAGKMSALQKDGQFHH
jgi:hypothetical protein